VVCTPSRILEVLEGNCAQAGKARQENRIIYKVRFMVI